MVVVSNILLSQQTQKEGRGTDAVITPWILSPCQVLSISSYSIPSPVVYIVAPANQFKASKPMAGQIQLSPSHFSAMFPNRTNSTFLRQRTDALGLASLGGANESMGSGHKRDRCVPRVRLSRYDDDLLPWIYLTDRD
jgi:hypothetical protein